MKLFKNRGDVVGAAFLALIVLGGVALWTAGYEWGLAILLVVAGISAGMALSYFATRPLRTRKPVAVLLGLGSLALYVFFPPGSEGFASPYKALFFGIFFGVSQVVLRALLGGGVRTGG